MIAEEILLRGPEATAEYRALSGRSCGYACSTKGWLRAVLPIRWCNSGETTGLVSSELLEREELPMKAAIVTGSTRSGRNNEAFARWVYEVACNRRDARFDLVDTKDRALPLLDELAPPAEGRYSQVQMKAWGGTLRTLRTNALAQDRPRVQAQDSHERV